MRLTVLPAEKAEADRLAAEKAEADRRAVRTRLNPIITKYI